MDRGGKRADERGHKGRGRSKARFSAPQRGGRRKGEGRGYRARPPAPKTATVEAIAQCWCSRSDHERLGSEHRQPEGASTAGRRGGGDDEAVPRPAAGATAPASATTATSFRHHVLRAHRPPSPGATRRHHYLPLTPPGSSLLRLDPVLEASDPPMGRLDPAAAAPDPSPPPRIFSHP